MNLDKLSYLGAAAKYDICASTSSGVNRVKNPQLGGPVSSGICHSFTPDGRCVSLLKVLMSNECSKDCAYCANRIQRNIKRTSFTAEELCRIFIELYKRNYVEGLFLSSGIKNSPLRTMEEMLKAAEILRLNYRFGGYIHLKVLPGSTPDLIAGAIRYANRVSLNLEVPNERCLRVVSKSKDYSRELLTPLALIGQAIEKNPGITHTTQFVVGAAGETDLEILEATNKIYTQHGIKRAYFSAFQPLPDTPLENLPTVPLKRENRLYQADFLMRKYHFKYNDLIFDSSGFLDLTLDPKLMFAINNSQLYPIEINRATRSQLLLVPGIGPLSANKITASRRQFHFTGLEELKNLGVVVKRAAPFITVNGKKFNQLNWLMNPNPRQFIQLSLW